jgi:hypothetical protein
LSVSCCSFGLSFLYFSWSTFILGWSVRIPAIDLNCLSAIGNISRRTMNVRQMIATPKLPVTWNSHCSSEKIGRMNHSNQPQSIDFDNLVMPPVS